ncbi:sigma-70 family RNA polymerase sigma factor [Bacillus salipaludis]|uniref:Sigma-70 family RNA polymerase sigma factor n=1 Tax=Bacillus salipaludis TaxID=2547811 RepID=A0A4R5VVL3_9BACI|nr:sigma-70 family RNA polymerase sigma factor [Bacillus salipaludis]MDQ6597285.1 sigma-70 family RNA polymerase sigma factor [Bacillus salipaludis]TDK63274.1 sigma-70 family RNA polymerase sigma factor [Bacillus salipaludis]
MLNRVNSCPVDNEEESLWIEYYPKLKRYCHFLAQNQWDGDDIAQETILKALKNYTINEKMSSALLNKMAYNHWVDQIRKRKNESIEAEVELNYEEARSQLDNIMATVDIMLRQFTPKQAVIFLLKEGFQYQLKEIADLLNTTEMAVKANLHRSKQRLEKAKEEGSAEKYWDEEEREVLSELFYEALKLQDPTVLIEMVPQIKSVVDSPKLVTLPLKQTHFPISALCMAA